MLKAWMLLVALCTVVPDAEQDRKPATYVVVVNAKNPVSLKGKRARAVVKKLFLKQLGRWPGGAKARPYGRPLGTAAQKQFLKTVLSMGDAELARHWIRIKNLKGATAPKGVASDRMLLKYVSKHAGAFGVVKLSDAKKQQAVKILFQL